MAFALISKPTAAAKRPVIQTKLKVGEPNDQFEKEADRVADEVLKAPQSRPATQVQRAPSSVQRTCSACEEEQKVRRIPSTTAEPVNPTVEPPIEQSIRHARNSGAALPSATRSFLEPRFGRDLGGVRIHADRASSQLAQRLQSRAFTVGSDIFFAPGEFQPHTPGGMRVLSHELTHVAQQGAVPATASPRGPAPLVTGGAGGSIQREVAPWRIEPSSKVLDKIQDIANSHLDLGKNQGPAVANLMRLISLGLGFNPGSDPSERKNSFVYTCNCGWIDMGHFFISAAAAYMAAYLESSVKLNVNDKQQDPSTLMAAGMDKAKPYLRALLKTVSTGDKDQEILDAVDRLLASETPTGVGLALGYGMEFYQQIIKLIADQTKNPGDFLKGSQRSAFTMEDLPSDCYGVDFGRNLWARVGTARLDSLPHREMMEEFFSKCGAVYPTGKTKCAMMNETTPGSCKGEGNKEDWASGEPYRYTSPNPFLLESAKPLCPSPKAAPCTNAAVVTGKETGPGEQQLPKAQVDISTKRGTASLTYFDDLKLPDTPLVTKGQTIVGLNKRGGFFGSTTLKGVPSLGDTRLSVEGSLPSGRIHGRAEAGSLVQVDVNANVSIDFDRLFKGLIGSELKQVESTIKAIIKSDAFKQLLVRAVTMQIGKSEFVAEAKALLKTVEGNLSRQFPEGIGGVIDTVVGRLAEEVALATSLNASGTLSIAGVPATVFFAHKSVGKNPVFGAEVGSTLR